MEQIAKQEAKMSGKRFRPALEAPYRWRDWAAKADGHTGDELIAFVNNEEAVRPDGKKGAGLFAYLRSLQGANGGDRRDVIATVFKGTINRMINGYLLRDVINKVTTSTSPAVTRSTPSAISTSPCSRRCATPPATPASSTRRVRSSASWSKSSTRSSAK